MVFLPQIILFLCKCLQSSSFKTLVSMEMKLLKNDNSVLVGAEGYIITVMLLHSQKSKPANISGLTHKT